MIFDEEFYNGGVGYPKYSNYPYFKSRAEWIKITFPDEKIIEIGCAYGYLLEHLPGVIGIDKSEYAYSRRVNDRVFLADATKYDYTDFNLVISFNVLDCMNDEEVKSFLSRTSNLKHFHLISFYDDDPMNNEYLKMGYFIRDRKTWFSLFSSVLNEVYLVDNDGKITVVDIMKVVAHWGETCE